MPDTVLVDVAFPNPGDVIAQQPVVQQSAGTWTRTNIAKPPQVPPGAAFYVGATGTSAAGKTGERTWVQYVAAPTVTPADPTVTFPQALGTLSPRPSWADDFRAMFGVAFNPATTEGSQSAFMPTRTVTLDLTDVGTFTGVPAFNGAWMNYFGNRVGYAGKWRDGDRLLIPQRFLSAADNLDIPPSVTNVELVFGTAESQTVVRHYQDSGNDKGMERHAVRVLGAQKIRMRAASRAFPAVFETVGAVGRTGLNQQGNTMLLLDPGTADFQAQDLILKGARAAGFFAYRATRYWLNRVQSIETQADAFHNTNGSTYGLFTNCTTKKSGDDGWACVRYNGESLVQQSNHLAVVRHRVEQTGHGRGFANICCSDIWWDQIYIEGSAAAALIVDREASSGTPALGIYNHLGQRIHLKGGNWSEQDHGPLFLNNGQSNEEVHLRLESVLIEDAHYYRETIRAVGGTGPVLEAVLKDVKATGGMGNVNNQNSWFGGNNKSRIVFDPAPVRNDSVGADSTPPTLVFLAPGPSATVSGSTVDGPMRKNSSGVVTGTNYGATGEYRNTMLAFYAGDNRNGVKSVEVKIGDTVVATVPKANLDPAGRVALTGIDWGQFANGAGRITITATDDSGRNTGTHTREVLVNNPASGSLTPLPSGGTSTPSDTTAPTAPTNLVAARASNSSTDGSVSWSPSTDVGSGVLGYHVYWTPAGGATTRLNSSIVAGTSFGTTGLSASEGVVAVEAVDASPSANTSTRVGVALGGYTAPTPVATGGRPSTTRTLLADWDAVGSGATGARAETLFDTSGATRHLQQAATASRPEVVAGPKAGQKALRFNDAFMRNAATGLTGQTRATLSLVMRVDSQPARDNAGVFAATLASPNPQFDFYQNTGAFSFAIPRYRSETTFTSGAVAGSVVNAQDSAFSVTPGLPFGQWCLVEFEFGTDGQPARVWVDGTKVAELAGRTLAAGLALGALSFGGRSYADQGFADYSRVTIARALMHEGVRPDSTVAWAQSVYGVAGAAQSDTTPPAPPTNVRASRPASGVVRVAWDAASDNIAVDHYDVLGAVAGGDPTKINAQPIPATVLTYDWSGVSNSNGYFVTVEAVDAAGNRAQANAGTSVGAFADPAATGYVAQSANSIASSNAKTAQATLPATPTQGRYLVTSLAVDKTLGGTITAPAGGWALAGVWQGTAGTGLVVATKVAGVDEPRTVTWLWPGSGGGAMLVAELDVNSGSLDGAPVVVGTEDAVTTIAANSPAAAASTVLRVALGAIDSAGSNIPATTWPASGPSFTGAALRAYRLGDTTNGSAAVALATTVLSNLDAATISVDANNPDQMAIIVLKVKGGLGSAAPAASPPTAPAASPPVTTMTAPAAGSTTGGAPTMEWTYS